MIEQRKIVWPNNFVSPFTGCKTVLDLGCARGSKLNKICGTIGATGLGIDLRQFCVENARKNSLTAIQYGDVVEVARDLLENSFDGILMADLLHCLPREQSLELVSYAKRIARLVVVTSLPVEHRGWRQYEKQEQEPEMKHKSQWTLQQAHDLWGDETLTVYDPDFIERIHHKKGPEYIEWLKKEQYNGKFAVMTLSVWRKHE